MLNNLKIRFLSIFREVFLYHYTSLEFRAKLFAFIIDGDDNYTDEHIKEVENIGMGIYADKDRAKALSFATEEFLKRVKYKNRYDIDYLIKSIQRDLTTHKRYANKINRDIFDSLLKMTKDEEDRVYQEKIVDFLIDIKKSVDDSN